jgi:uncharacterized membrane protein
LWEGFFVALLGVLSRDLIMQNSIFKKLLSYVLNGMLITLPVVATGYIIYHVFMWLDSLIPGERDYPGLGILMLVVILAVVGWFGTRFINDTIKRWGSRLLDQMPLIKTIYKSITDLLGAFVGSKKSFDKPVLVKLNSDLDVEVIGFVTDEDLSELGSISGKIAVYVPMSYSFSGHLIVVPAANVKPVDRNAIDVFKYIVSGGVVEIDPGKHESQK